MEKETIPTMIAITLTKSISVATIDTSADPPKSIVNKKRTTAAFHTDVLFISPPRTCAKRAKTDPCRIHHAKCSLKSFLNRIAR
jgi:hypothetical protein